MDHPNLPTLALTTLLCAASLAAVAQADDASAPSAPAKPGLKLDINPQTSPPPGAPGEPRTQGNDYGRQGLEAPEQPGEEVDASSESIDIDEEVFDE